jgi:hypothetical protein
MPKQLPQKHYKNDHQKQLTIQKSKQIPKEE